MTTHVAPRRPTRTYQWNGRETYADTGRAVDERLGSHVVLWIVEDPEAWAAAIEADGDAEPARWSKNQQGIGQARKEQRYASATQIRAAGARCDIRGHHHRADHAAAEVAGLRQAHPNPGVRYAVAEISEARACPHCQQPTIRVEGRWHHHYLRYPVECEPQPQPEPEFDDERQPGEFEINIGLGSMTCGYCDRTETWTAAFMGTTRLTGFHLFGIELATGDLVVLAEASTPSGAVINLPHHCDKIPDEIRDRYADELRAARGQLESGTSS